MTENLEQLSEVAVLKHFKNKLNIIIIAFFSFVMSVRNRGLDVSAGLVKQRAKTVLM